MLVPLKLLGEGLVVCIAIVVGGLRGLIAALLRVVLAGTAVAVALS